MTEKRKPNIDRVREACESIGVKLEGKKGYRKAQWIVNLAVDYFCGIIRKMHEPDEVVALLQDYLKFLEPTGKYFGADKEIYDLTSERQRNEIESTFLL